MQRAITAEPTKATIGLMPYTTNGVVKRRTRLKSTIHITVASASAASPPVNSTYELVQRLLLIGNTQFHMSPAIIASAPVAERPARRSESGRRSPIQRPARLPSITVPTAGTVESTPSGSQVTLEAHRWLPSPQRLQSRTTRSTQAAIDRVGSFKSSAPIVPSPGTGSTVITIQ